MTLARHTLAMSFLTVMFALIAASFGTLGWFAGVSGNGGQVFACLLVWGLATAGELLAFADLVEWRNA